MLSGATALLAPGHCLLYLESLLYLPISVPPLEAAAFLLPKSPLPLPLLTAVFFALSYSFLHYSWSLSSMPLMATSFSTPTYRFPYCFGGPFLGCPGLLFLLPLALRSYHSLYRSPPGCTPMPHSSLPGVTTCFTTSWQLPCAWPLPSPLLPVDIFFTIRHRLRCSSSPLLCYLKSYPLCCYRCHFLTLGGRFFNRSHLTLPHSSLPLSLHPAAVIFALPRRFPYYPRLPLLYDQLKSLPPLVTAFLLPATPFLLLVACSSAALARHL